MNSETDLESPPMEMVTMASILHALGDETRLQIARNLYVAGRPLTCQEGVKGIPSLPISTRSHCYKLLREGGVMKAKKQGRECYGVLRLQEIERKYPGLLKAILG